MCLCHLRQVNLIMPLRVTQPVFVSIGLPFSGPLICPGFQLLDRTIPIHFEINTNSAIHWAAWHVDVKVGNSSFDDFFQDIVRFLIVCNSHPRALRPRRKTCSHTSWQSTLRLERQVKKAIYLSRVIVIDGYPSCLLVRVFGRCLIHQMIQEIIECFVVRLQTILAMTLFDGAPAT